MKSYANTERKLSKIVVSNIKFFRIKAWLSEEELSIKIGKKENFIKRLENLEFKREPTTDLLDRIGKVLKIEAQEFFIERK